MPCIIFSVHLRQQAAHYLHSTQISGLVSAGISFRSEWICLFSKGSACRTHLLKGVTLKRACVPCFHSTQFMYLSEFIRIFDTCKNKSCCKRVTESQGKKKKIEFQLLFRSDYFLPEQRPIIAKVSASCIVPRSFLLSHCLEARCVMLLLRNDFREAAHP